MATRTITTPTPMPGQLAVSYDSVLLNTRVDDKLNEAPTGVHVIAVGVLTRVRHLDPIGGPVMAALTGADGHWAFATFPAAIAADLAPLLYEGTRVLVVGEVTRNTPRFGIKVYSGARLAAGESGASLGTKLLTEAQKTDAKPAAA
jgi:hypothetical protein